MHAILDKIDSPADLKKLGYSDLDQLALSLPYLPSLPYSQSPSFIPLLQTIMVVRAG